MGADMRELGVAWAAGFIDGEGSFMIMDKGGKQRGVMRLILNVSQSMTREPLDTLVNLFGGRVVKATRLTVTGRPVWIWSVTGGEGLRMILPQIIPHLRVKRRQAELALEFAHTIGPRGAKLTDDMHEKRESIIRQLKEDKMISTTERGQ